MEVLTEMFAAGLILAVAGVAAILFLWFQRPVTITKRKTTSTTAAPRASAVTKGRGVKLVQASSSAEGSEDTHDPPETDAGIDIIAIHGLDTNSPHTWEFKKEDGGKVNWLADKHMLPAEIPGTRIFTCDWPAEALETKDSVSLRIQELALSLLQGILGSDLERKRPILFVASCLGGIILMQALVEAKDEYACIREATRGVIFLATPFRGTAFQDSAIWAQPALRIKALVLGKKVSKLLGWLNEPTFDLTRLVGQFTRLCKGRDHEGVDVFTFYETGTTYLPAQVPLLSFLLPGSKKPLVDMSSATLDCVSNPLPLHRNHSKMNKFCGPMDSDPDYKSVVEAIKRFLLTIRTGTPLEQADAWIREKHYDKQRLKIERLSGGPLEMSKCYINLALVEIHKVDNSKQRSEGPSPFSLTERLKLESPHDDLRVELPKLFQPRKTPDGKTWMPKRILIRGRAGVGKTTLCKKIVYDFIHGGMWQDLFKRVVWVRLRELKSLQNDSYSLDRVLRNIFFRQHSQQNKLCTELWRHIEDTQSRDTLFLLDGLDEVQELTMEYKHGNPHPAQELLKGLLNRPNVIITTRPHATFPNDFQQPDLELDTMGFSQDQVHTYIEAVMLEDTDTIGAYLEKHRIMQSLVQIPIQLDALCFTWQGSSVWNTIIPETMTAVYEAMVGALWSKDNERLEKDGLQIIGNAFPAETDPFDSTQYTNLGYLAFSGLCSNVIEFQPHHRNALYRFMRKERTSLSFDETFARLSFWRTSDPFNKLPNQSYHFIHLTFQEYFAAKHFAKAWRYDQDLEFIELDGERVKRQVVSCRKFLGKHKFTARYNIMWRFVAGILDEDEAQTSHFLEAIEREPVDMLGPTQQRLVMYCLAEVTQSTDLRIRLEDQLSQWLEFELDFRGSSQFVCEAEFPERAINHVLERASEKAKIATLQSLARRRSFLPLTTAEYITGYLDRGEPSQPLRVAALKVFLDRPLPIRTLNFVVALMDDDDMETRNMSVEILRSQAPWPDGILRAVMTRLESKDSDQDSGIRQRTARALGWHSRLSVALLRRMTQWMNDRDPYTIRAVLETLGYQHKLDGDIIRSMARKLEDRRQSVRASAFEIIQEREDLPLDISETMAIWLEEDMSVNEISTYKNFRNRLPDNMLRALERRLECQDRSVQQRSLNVLQREHKNRPEVPFDDVFNILVKWLEGGDSESKRLALKSLDSESELPNGMIKAVRAQLQKHQDQDIFHLGFKILIQKISFGGVMDNTVDWLKDGDQYDKRLTLQFHGSEDLLPTGVLKAIAERLNDQDEAIRKTALETLGALGSYEGLPNEVVSAITEQIYNAEEGTRRAAAKALSEIWDRQSLPVELLEDIVTELRSDDPARRKAASDNLAVIGHQLPFPDGIFHAIAIHLADPDKEIKYAAAKALRDLSCSQELPGHVVQAIATLLEDPDSRIRCASVMTLRTLVYEQTFPDELLLPLAALLKDTDGEIRHQAMETLGRRGRQQTFPHDILELMLNQLGDSRTQNRHFAFEAFAHQSWLPGDTLQVMVVSGLRERDLRTKRAVLDLVRRLPKMSEEIRSFVVAMLGDERVRLQAVGALASHEGLSVSIYPAMAKLLESDYSWERGSAAELLGTSPTLAGEILEAVIRRVDDRYSWVKQAALEALKGQHRLPDAILKSTASYSLWLERSFKEDFYCSIEEGVAYLELPAGLGKLPLWGEPNELRETIRKRQIELGMPVRSTEIARRL